MGETPEEALGPLVDPLTGEPIPGRNVDGEVGKRLREVEQANRLARTIGLALQAMAVLILAGTLGYLIVIGQTNKRGVARIVDCTTQGHACYEEQQKRVGELVGQLVEATNASRDEVLKTSYCIIEQLAEHRDTNEIAHRKNATIHGYTYSAPSTEIPPPIPETLKSACLKYLPPVQGGTRGGTP